MWGRDASHAALGTVVPWYRGTGVVDEIMRREKYSAADTSKENEEFACIARRLRDGRRHMDMASPRRGMHRVRTPCLLPAARDMWIWRACEC